jgi:hypothetical protein
MLPLSSKMLPSQWKCLCPCPIWKKITTFFHL